VVFVQQCSCGAKWSITVDDHSAAMMPHRYKNSFKCTAGQFSILGRMREKHVAANIDTRGKPEHRIEHFLVTFLVKRAGNAPTPVSSPGSTSPAATIQKSGILPPHMIELFYFTMRICRGVSNQHGRESFPIFKSFTVTAILLLIGRRDHANDAQSRPDKRFCRGGKRRSCR